MTHFEQNFSENRPTIRTFDDSYQLQKGHFYKTADFFITALRGVLQGRPSAEPFGPSSGALQGPAGPAPLLGPSEYGLVWAAETMEQQ